MRKIHLRRNKEGTGASIAACATNPNVAKARRNFRQTYQFMASEIVAWPEFKVLPDNCRCMHCVEAAKVIVNRQRKAKGLAPKQDIFAPKS